MPGKETGIVRLRFRVTKPGIGALLPELGCKLPYENLITRDATSFFAGKPFLYFGFSVEPGERT